MLNIFYTLYSDDFPRLRILLIPTILLFTLCMNWSWMRSEITVQLFSDLETH